MDANSLESLIFIVCFAVSFALAVRMRRSKQVYIADYQAGLRFRGDASSVVLPPGAYRTRASGTPITVVDLRPHQFILERLAFQDLLNENCVVSVGGELRVRDPKAAVNAFKNLLEDSLAIIRERLRSAVLQCIIDTSAEGRLRMAAIITAELNRELESRGVAIDKMEITELWVQAIEHKVSTEAN